MAAFMETLNLPHDQGLLPPLSPAGMLLRMASNLVHIYEGVHLGPCRDIDTGHSHPPT